MDPYLIGGAIGFVLGVWSIWPSTGYMISSLRHIYDDDQMIRLADGAWYPKGSNREPPPPPPAPPPPITEGRCRGNIKVECVCRPMPEGPPPSMQPVTQEGK